ncbi:MAG TPA: DNA-deoxyinosine glycosylase [Treponemataceae bacterium]|nr:DNA-deoxyinosine glycosylase [Treponemataceae bacterium]
MSARQMVQHGIDPVFDGSSEILVLGTMPSPASREVGFYYSHPQNRFWQVLSAVFDEPLPYTIDQKKRLVLSHGIALWDVLASCEMEGAEDSSIKKPVANDFSAILSASSIKTVYTTGEKADYLYKKLCRHQIGIDSIMLPSTSPANRGRYPLNTLIEIYSVLRKG